MDSSSIRSHRGASQHSIQHHAEEPTLLYAQYPAPYHHHYHSNRHANRLPLHYTNPVPESSDQQRLVERHGHSYASQPVTVFDEEDAELQRQQQRLIEYQQRQRHQGHRHYFYQPPGHHEAGMGVGVEAERDGSQMIHSLLRQADELQDMIIEWMESVGTEETEEEEEEDQQEDEQQEEIQATVVEDEPSGGISSLTRACLLSCSYRLTSRHWSTCHDDNSQHLPTVCSVCLDDICVGSQLVTLPCAHVFHTNCVLTWLERSQYCPLCRTLVNMGEGGEAEEDMSNTEPEIHSRDTTVLSSSSYASVPLITIAIGPVPSSSDSRRRSRRHRFRY